VIKYYRGRWVWEATDACSRPIKALSQLKQSIFVIISGVASIETTDVVKQRTKIVVSFVFLLNKSRLLLKINM
jgi:hypothetical protein